MILARHATDQVLRNVRGFEPPIGARAVLKFAGRAAEQAADPAECGMMGHGRMMGHGMMGRGMMRHGMMAHRGMMDPLAMRMIFALIDTDGDGTISLQEWQAAHEKIFKAMDPDKDGTVTFEEMMNFMRGVARPPQGR